MVAIVYVNGEKELAPCLPNTACGSCERCNPVPSECVVFMCCSCGKQMTTEGDGECVACWLESEAA